MSLTPLSQSIFRTLSYFDNFNLPLTAEELYKYLWQPPFISLEQFYAELEKLSAPLDFQSGFYFLAGKDNLVEERRKMAVASQQRLAAAQKAINKLRYLPFISAVFVCNNVAFETASADSDIDVFIVVKPGRIWLTRFLATLVLSLFGLRRYKNKITNKICLSFYATADNLDFRKIAIAESDIYLLYWLCFLTPILDRENARQKIWEANRAWIKKFLPNVAELPASPTSCQALDSRFSRVIKNILEKFWRGAYGDLIENQAKGLQLVKMKMNLHSAQNEQDTRVIINDQMLKFHENDRRLFYHEQWLAKIRALGL